ncbi:MAG: pilin [Patescibacteria group bacterium]
MFRFAQLKSSHLKLALFLALIGSALLWSDLAIAADFNLNSPELSPLGTISNSGNALPIIIGRIIRAVLGLTGVLALVMFIYSGVLWMTSQGNSTTIGKAKQTMIWSILGLVVIFSSYALVNFVMAALNQT